MKALIHSGRVEVPEIELNFASCADKRDSKFFIDFFLPRRVFHTRLNS